jgi:ribonuclease D
VSPKLPRPQFIRRAADLKRLVEQLRAHPLLAVDTESNSLYAYHERVCLVQLSTRENDYIIDPLAINDMSPLGLLLADPTIEIIFHAAEYDIITLKRDFSFTFSNLFDTMLAARICGWKKVGLGNILEEQFDVRANKKHQRADWSLRPLPDDQLQYAQMDTHYLPALRDRLLAELTTSGRLDEARESFADLPDYPPAERQFDPEGYWRIHETKTLSRNQMAIVRELYLLRDQIAQRRDWPPFKVFNDETLVKLAALAPRRVEDLENMRGLNERVLQRDGPHIIEAVARGRQAPPPRPPPRPDSIPDPDVLLRFEALHEWRKQRAAERGVESDIIVPRGALWAMARRPPKSLDDLDNVPGLGPWRRATYGAELLAVLAKANEGGI